MKKILRTTAFIVSLCMAASIFCAAVFVSPAFGNATAQTTKISAKTEETAGLGSLVGQYSESDIVTAIVTMGDPIAHSFKPQNGEFSQFLASGAAEHLTNVSDSLHDEVLRGIKRLGIDFRLLYRYQVVANAVAIEVGFGDIEKIRALSMVERVEIAASRQLLFDEDCAEGDSAVGVGYAVDSAAGVGYAVDSAAGVGYAVDSVAGVGYAVDSAAGAGYAVDSAAGSAVGSAKDISNNSDDTNAENAALQQKMQLMAANDELTDAGTYDTASLDYSGEGMLIGIIDSAAMPAHEAFSIAPPAPKYTDASYLSQQVINSLNAKSKMADVTAAQLFKSQKIPFAFDYHGGDTDLSGLDHGVRVAGIAAGNNGKDFFGSAKNAQLAIFKVYGDNGSSASDADIVAAIEDAVKIGVDVLNLSFGVPAGFMDKYDYAGVFESVAAAGVILCAAAGNNSTSAYMTNSTDSARLENPDSSAIAYPATHPQNIAVASFSKNGDSYNSTSWGPAADLTLKPELAAAGLSIKSAVKSGGYGEQSGTSVASPNAAGGAAVIKQFLAEKGLAGTQLGDAVASVITASATPLKTEDGYYSPRVQGAGFASLKNATQSGAYIKVEGTNKAKLELGDDSGKTGIFSKEFTLKSLGAARSYKLSGVVQTDSVDGDYIGNKPHTLDAQVSFFVKRGEAYTLLGDNTLWLGEGAEQTVKVLITLSKKAKTYLASFPNGGFVEGFVFLDSDTAAENNGGSNGNGGSNVGGSGQGAADLSLPFLGFFGDWLAVPIFDTDTYGAGTMQTKAENTGIYAGSSEYVSYILGSYSKSDLSPSFLNKLTNQEIARLSARGEYSAIGLSIESQILYAQFGLLRNAKNLHYTLTDPVTGEVLYKSQTLKDRIKGLYHAAGNSFNNKMDLGFSPKELYESGEIDFKNNTRLLFSVNAATSCGDFANRVDDSITVPLYVDLESPSVLAVRRANEYGKEYLTLTTRDNHYVRTIQMYYKKNDAFGTRIYRDANQGTPVIAFSQAATINTAIELSDDFLNKLGTDSKDGKLYVEVEDFARNKTEVVLGGIVDGTVVWDEPTAPSLIYRESAAVNEVYSGETFVENGATYYKLTGAGAERYVLLGYQDSPERTALLVKSGTVRIAALAFKDAKSLQQITLPSTLKRIGEAAFFGCDNLTAYKFLGMDAPLLEVCLDSFYGENRHPYNHFGDIYNPPFLSLSIKTGATGFDGWVWNTYFGVRNASGYKVTFDSAGGSEVEGQTVLAGEGVTAPVPPTKEGHSFAGWYTASDHGELFEFGSVVAADTVLYAKWAIRQFSVTYVLGIPQAAPTQADIEYGGSFTVKGLQTAEGYSFLGWHDQSGKIYSAGDKYEGVERDVILTAVLNKNLCTLTFDSRGGGEIAPISGYFGDIIPNLEDAQREGYTFTGWYIDADCTQRFEGGTFGDVRTLYAGWEKEAGGCSCGTTSLPMYLMTIPLAFALSLLLIHRKKTVCNQ